MKKLISYALAACALGALATSCSSDEPLAGGQDGNVTFTVQLPQELASRATFGNGLSSQNLTAVAYFQGTTTIADIKENVSFNGGLTTTVSFNLANGQDYDIVFWASDASCAYTLNNYNATVTLDATKLAANVESQDAFFAKESLTTNGQGLNKTVKLYRPFAQLNLGTSDLASAAVAGNKTAGITGAYESGVYTTVSAKAYNSLNLLTNAMGTLTNVEFPGVAANPTGETFPESGYDYLSMVYLLVDTKTAEDVTFNFYDGDPKAATPGTKKHTLTVPNTPLQRNYQTNIYGALLTTTAEYNVEIVPTFNTPANDILVWNGTAAEPTAVDATAKTVTISTPSELAWVAQYCNTTRSGNSGKYADGFNGWTVNLAADIELGNLPWTPIGTEIWGNGAQANAFNGTFDGNNHVITNLNVSGDYDVAGLFGNIGQSGTVKNLTLRHGTVNNTHHAASADETCSAGVAGIAIYAATLENCTVEDFTVTGTHYVGGIVGYISGTTKNCTVTGSTLSSVPVLNGSVYEDGKSCGGAVGMATRFKASYPMPYGLENCTVTDCTVKAYQRCGAVVGCANEGVAPMSCKATDCTLLINNIPAGASYDGNDVAGTNFGSIIGWLLGGLTLDPSNVATNVTLPQ